MQPDRLDEEMDRDINYLGHTSGGRELMFCIGLAVLLGFILRFTLALEWIPFVPYMLVWTGAGIWFGLKLMHYIASTNTRNKRQTEAEYRETIEAEKKKQIAAMKAREAGEERR